MVFVAVEIVVAFVGTVVEFVEVGAVFAGFAM